MNLDLGPHAAFIVAAYLATLVVVGALTVWIVAEHRALRRALADLERAGAGRVVARPR